MFEVAVIDIVHNAQGEERVIHRGSYQEYEWPDALHAIFKGISFGNKVTMTFVPDVV